jgi:SAM-dependent methyltransferase
MLTHARMDGAAVLHRPALEGSAHEQFTAEMRARDDETPRLERLLTLIGRLVDLREHRRVCVLGCGPAPQTMRVCRGRGLDAVGVEPVPSFVAAAAEYLGAPGLVLQGAAEAIPLPSESQDVVFFESVLEHVDSPSISLAEIYRVLRPGGIVYLETTNRHRVSLRGRNDEYNVRFYNWLPALVKECYVHRHLHFDPSLANFSQRPAVHWFSYTDLCRLGREAGFAHFYSLLDLKSASDAPLSGNPVKRAIQGSDRLLRAVQRNPWLRALALTQLGGTIIMRKRDA